MWKHAKDYVRGETSEVSDPYIAGQCMTRNQTTGYTDFQPWLPKGAPTARLRVCEELRATASVSPGSTGARHHLPPRRRPRQARELRHRGPAPGGASGGASGGTGDSVTASPAAPWVPRAAAPLAGPLPPGPGGLLAAPCQGPWPGRPEGGGRCPAGAGACGVNWEEK